MKIRTRARIPFQIISACAGSKACYISETTRHICTRNNEHHLSDKASHVDKYLQSSKACHNSCSVESYTNWFCRLSFSNECKRGQVYQMEKSDSKPTIKTLRSIFSFLAFFFKSYFVTHLLLLNCLFLVVSFWFFLGYFKIP